MAPTFTGTVPNYGEEGKIQMTRAFAKRLGELSPTKRRLAIARACMLPWRDSPGKAPDCYTHELAMASWEADEEDRVRGCSPDHRDVDEALSISGPDPLINEIFLRQLIAVPPARRRNLLFGACLGPWVDEFVEGGTPPEFPDWIICTNKYLGFQSADERHLQER